jgi:hypothetical protein
MWAINSNTGEISREWQLGGSDAPWDGTAEQDIPTGIW